MKKLLPLLGIPLVALSFSLPNAPVWGFFGHKRINRLAVFTLPQELLGFYKPHLEFVTEHAVDPDKRRYASPFEAPRHYIDLDRYGEYDREAEIPFAQIPRYFPEALQKLGSLDVVTSDFDTLHLLHEAEFGDTLYFKMSETLYPVHQRDWRNFYYRSVIPNRYEDTWTVSCDSLRWVLNRPDLDCQELTMGAEFMEHGILPWHLKDQVSRLSRAFEKRDLERILRYSADLGHYVGDAHVPLHTTENYNGQLTGQKGIHAFWESRIPELFADEEYDYFVGPAEYIDNVQEYVWDIVLKSHSYVDSVLLIEADLRRTFPVDLQMCYVQRGSSQQYLECEAFAKAYQERMRGMVEERMRASIRSVGSLWYTAWVDAGQPNMTETPTVEPVADQSLEQQFQGGNIKGRQHAN